MTGQERNAERNRDRDLLRRFCGGDRDAFTTIYRAHHAAVFRFALHMTADRMKAAEATQDLFVWLIQHPDDFDAERGELGSFLIGVTRKLLQRRQHNERRLVSLTEAGADPEYRYYSQDTREAESTELRNAIAALPERYREAVVLCDLEEKSYEDAASILDCAIGTVRSRLHRARGLLARKLKSRQGCSV
jgi:RNA polymerase sigma-70 factor (ECF subfamily)